MYPVFEACSYSKCYTDVLKLSYQSEWILQNSLLEHIPYYGKEHKSIFLNLHISSQMCFSWHVRYTSHFCLFWFDFFNNCLNKFTSFIFQSLIQKGHNKNFTIIDDFWGVVFVFLFLFVFCLFGFFMFVCFCLFVFCFLCTC